MPPSARFATATAAPAEGGDLTFAIQNDPISLKRAWDMYKAYCDETRLEFTMPMYKFREALKDYYASFPQAKVAYEQLQYAQPELTTYSAAEMWQILNDNIQAAVTGEMTAEEALAAAQEQGDELLADYR